MTLASLSLCTSSGFLPSSARISDVCCPSAGPAQRVHPGVPTMTGSMAGSVYSSSPAAKMQLNTGTPKPGRHPAHHEARASG